MARVIQYVDDIDGTLIEEGRGGPVSLTYKGRSYVIDLSEKNQAALDSALEPFLRNAAEGVRPTGPAADGHRRRSAANGSGRSREQLSAIRAWAKSKGLKVSERGRISAEILDRFDREAGK